MSELSSALEAILFISGEPIKQKDFCECFGITYLQLEDIIAELREKYNEHSGINFICFGDSMQFATNPVYKEQVEKLLNPVQKKSLSQASLEVLSIIAYKQPITRGEIEEIRGVKCDYSVMWLLQKGLICEAGRKEALGRPMLFATTDLFLRHFGLQTLSDLPDEPAELAELNADSEE